MKPNKRLGSLELEVLQYVTDNQPATVREVADHAQEKWGKARTTVLTVMERLRQKGYLKRKKSRGVYRYLPTVSGPEVLKGLVKNFVERSLGGSVSPFVAYLTEEAELDEAELAELKRLVRELDAQQKERRS